MTDLEPEGKARGGTKGRIVEAALETLKRSGFAGASARDIGRTGGFNQALIFYHFGTVNDLLLAALDETSARRMVAYREAVAGAGTLPELVDIATRIYREDLESGHIKVLAEMIAGSSAHPELGPEIAARIEPWVHFAEDVLLDLLKGSPLESLIPARQVAHAVVAFYLGVELLDHLQPDRFGAGPLFDLAGRTAPLVAGLVVGPGSRRSRP
jgi:AcrR family transcriptional regulator